MEIFKRYAASHKILFAKKAADGVAIWDKNDTLALVSFDDDPKAKRSVHVNNLAVGASVGNKVDFSADGVLFAACDAKAKNVRVIDITDKTLFTIEWHVGPIECVAFAHGSRYLATGGQDGKACIWTLPRGRFVFSLASHKDFVTCIKFSDDDRYIATGGYDNKINVKNLEFNKKVQVLKGNHGGFIKFIEFLPNRRLLSIDSHGTMVLWSMETCNSLKLLKKLPSEPISIELVFDKKYLLVACKDKNVYLYNVEEGTLVNDRLIREEDGITSIMYLEKIRYLVIARSTNSVVVYSLNDELERVESCVKRKKFYDAFDMIEKNPFLKREQIYEDLETLWTKTLELSRKLFEQGQRKKAESLVEPYIDVPQKSYEAKAFLNDYRDFETLVMMVKMEKYVSAYSLVEKAPNLKLSLPFRKMEKEWDEKFEKVKLGYVQQKMDQAKANRVLHNYKGVASKAQAISSMLQHIESVKLFESSLEKKEFKACAKLLVQHPFLQHLKAYSKFEKMGDLLHQRLLGYLDAKQYEKAEADAELLAYFSAHKQAAQQLKEKAHVLQKIQVCLRTHNYNELLLLQDRYTYVDDDFFYNGFKNKLQKTLIEAYDHAADGSIERVAKVLENYKSTAFLQERIGSIYSVAYIYQLHTKMKKMTNDKETLIKCFNAYIAYFGLDENLMFLLNSLRSNGVKVSVQEFDIRGVDYTRWATLKLKPTICS